MMRLIDGVTGQQLGVDDAYDRFFDGFYNLGKPSAIFAGNMVLGPARKRTRMRHLGKTRRSMLSSRRTRQLGGPK